MIDHQQLSVLKNAISILNEVLDNKKHSALVGVKLSATLLERYITTKQPVSETTDGSVEHVTELLNMVVRLDSFPMEVRLSMIEMAVVRLDHIICS